MKICSRSSITMTRTTARVTAVSSVNCHRKFGKTRGKVFSSGSILFSSSLRLNLFGYLSAEFIIGKLSRVCKPLREFILSSQSFWKYRYGQRVRSTYRRVPINDESWLHVCHELERKGHEWQRCGEQRHTILSISGPHIGPITDTILLDVKLSARKHFRSIDFRL